MLNSHVFRYVAFFSTEESLTLLTRVLFWQIQILFLLRVVTHNEAKARVLCQASLNLTIFIDSSTSCNKNTAAPFFQDNVFELILRLAEKIGSDRIICNKPVVSIDQVSSSLI